MNRGAAIAAALAIVGSGGIGGIVGDYRAAKIHAADLVDERKRLEIMLADERARIELANEATAKALDVLTAQYRHSLEEYRKICLD